MVLQVSCEKGGGGGGEGCEEGWRRRVRQGARCARDSAGSLSLLSLENVSSFPVEKSSFSRLSKERDPEIQISMCSVVVVGTHTHAKCRASRKPPPQLLCSYVRTSGTCPLGEVGDAAALDDLDVGEAVLDEQLRAELCLAAQRTVDDDRRVLRAVRDDRVLELGEVGGGLERESAEGGGVRAGDHVRARVLNVDEEDVAGVDQGSAVQHSNRWSATRAGKPELEQAG